MIEGRWSLSTASDVSPEVADSLEGEAALYLAPADSRRASINPNVPTALPQRLREFKDFIDSLSCVMGRHDSFFFPPACFGARGRDRRLPVYMGEID